MPRRRPNTRVKDLPDLPLLAGSRAISAQSLRAAPEQTFTFRDTHELPLVFPAPLVTWDAPYAAMAKENALPWATLAEVTLACGARVSRTGAAR